VGDTVPGTIAGHHPPVDDFADDVDHADPAWVANPFPLGDDLRGRCPAAHSERYGGAWLTTTHEAVVAVAYDTEHLTSRTVVLSDSFILADQVRRTGCPKPANRW
jgi:hypothetical protein